MNNKTSVGVLVSWLYAGLLMCFDKCVELKDPWDNWRNPLDLWELAQSICP